MIKKKKNKCFLLSLVVSFTSCEKKFSFLPSTVVDEYVAFLNPPRTHILLLSNTDLYFLEDEDGELLKLPTEAGKKTSVCLSPNGQFAVYHDANGRCHKVETKSGGSSKIITRLNGATHLHWTHDGLLYGVFTADDQAFVRFESASMPYKIPTFPLDSTLGHKLNDAVILSDSNVVFSRHFTRLDGLDVEGDQIVTWRSDSLDFVETDYSDFAFRAEALQIDKEGNLISYSSKDFKSDGLNYLIRQGKEDVFESPQPLSDGPSRHQISIANHITKAYIHENNALIFINDLQFKGFPNEAKDDTLRFEGINVINDFDIQIPIELTAEQKSPLD